MADIQKQLLSVREVGEVLGLNKSSIWRLARAGKLPQPIKVGGSTRWRRADIEAIFSREAA
jgi:excisionase family DNA binding protein